MMAHSHISFAASLWWLYSGAMGMPITGFNTLAAMVGGLLPDIDHPKSAIGRQLPLLSEPLSAIFGHRGFTHSLLAVVMILGVLFWATASGEGTQLRWLVVPLCVGYLSHILGDAFTPSGVPLFYPKRKTYSFKLFKTRSVMETVVVAILTLGVFFSLGVYQLVLEPLQMVWQWWNWIKR